MLDGLRIDWAREESKRFFFVKKKQKTFIRLAFPVTGAWGVRSNSLLISPFLHTGTERVKFFCFFFFKKRSASLLPSHHPIRNNRGPSLRNQTMATSVCGVSSPTSAQNCGPWFMWRRWATSWAAT